MHGHGSTEMRPKPGEEFVGKLENNKQRKYGL